MDPRHSAGQAGALPARQPRLPAWPPEATASGSAPWSSASTERPPRLPEPQRAPWQSTAAEVAPPFEPPFEREIAPWDEPPAYDFAQLVAADDEDPYDAFAPLVDDLNRAADPIEWPPVPTRFDPPASVADQLAWAPIPAQPRRPARRRLPEPAPEQPTLWDARTWQSQPPTPSAPVVLQGVAARREFEPPREGRAIEDEPAGRQAADPYAEPAELWFAGDDQLDSAWAADGPLTRDAASSPLLVGLLTVLVALAVIGMVVLALSSFTTLLN